MAKIKTVVIELKKGKTIKLTLDEIKSLRVELNSLLSSSWTFSNNPIEGWATTKTGSYGIQGNNFNIEITQ